MRAPQSISIRISRKRLCSWNLRRERQQFSRVAVDPIFDPRDVCVRVCPLPCSREETTSSRFVFFVSQIFFRFLRQTDPCAHRVGSGRNDICAFHRTCRIWWRWQVSKYHNTLTSIKTNKRTRRRWRRRGSRLIKLGVYTGAAIPITFGNKRR